VVMPMCGGASGVRESGFVGRSLSGSVQPTTALNVRNTPPEKHHEGGCSPLLHSLILEIHLLGSVSVNFQRSHLRILTVR
jgi:hypothetical protein